MQRSPEDHPPLSAASLLLHPPLCPPALPGSPKHTHTPLPLSFRGQDLGVGGEKL